MLHHFKNLLILILIIGCSEKSVIDPETSPKDEEIIAPPNSLFRTSVPKRDFDIIAVRPEKNSITFSILSYKTCNAFIDYALHGSTFYKSVNFSLSGNIPKEILIEGLQQSEQYDYYYNYRTNSSSPYFRSEMHSFSTVKNSETPFVFTVTADSHLDMNTDTGVYMKTLLNIFDSDPDFHIELGDTYMNDKYGKDYSMALYNYLAQRYYFGSICHSIPFYFVQGNHDGEYGFYNDGTSQCQSVWSNLSRKKYFPMPEQDNFYSGNISKDPFSGNLQDYYAWEWSNSLFIVLDPFWYSPPSGMNEPWDRSLGKDQYNWLKKVLETSSAKFKFVFIHNLTGGIDIDGKARGGAEAAPFFEWGGKSLNGKDEFEIHRPGWEMPIHSLLVKYGVDIVFHGHDHFYGYQKLDGIIYQELPQPGAFENSKPLPASAYGYKQGTFLPGTGYLKVSVNSLTAIIEYIETSIMDPARNKTVTHSYTIN